MAASPQKPPGAESAPVSKGQRTRERIFGCAMDLFMSHGYEKTTMRMIADRAGVNVALSYHYFPSKEHLVFEFYQNFARDFVERSAAVLASSSRLEARMIGVVETMFAAAGPYHAFAGSLFAAAASPASPLNPFSADFAGMRAQGDRPVRPRCRRIYARVFPWTWPTSCPSCCGRLSLGLLYCWMHDHSEHQAEDEDAPAALGPPASWPSSPRARRRAPAISGSS